MAVTERSRHNVHKHFEETMGEELAATLMELLPGVGWADVARRRDVEELRAATTHDIEELRAATTHDIEELRAATTHDIGQLRVETTREIEHLRDWASVRFDAIDKRMVTHDHLRTNTYKLISANAIVVSMIVGLAKFL